jgi:hypothetical protein
VHQASCIFDYGDYAVSAVPRSVAGKKPMRTGEIDQFDTPPAI